MPRLVLKDGVERRRCNVACDNCRKRKEKCDSLHPCAGCVKRNIECVFGPTNSNNNSNSTSAANATQSSKTGQRRGSGSTEACHPSQAKRRKTVHDITVNHGTDWNDLDSALNRCLTNPSEITRQDGNLHGEAEGANPPEFRHNGMLSPLNTPPPVSEAPVPRMARLFRDPRGKFVYIGDSSSLSFLHNVRRIVSCVVGETDLATDPLRDSFLEIPPTEEGSPADDDLPFTNLSNADLMLSLEQAEMLANQYLTATACLLDLFDTATLFRCVREWVTDNTFNDLGRPIAYLVMAIGAQVTATNGWDEVAERYFSAGRQLAYHHYTLEPSLQTVQAFILMAMFMLGSARRNAAFVNLGMAVRAAYALGLHRGDIQQLFPKAERQSRERVWQSLRVLDLYLSSSLGRPSATSDYEKDPDLMDPFGDIVPSTDDAKFASAVSGLCSIFERILNDVYKKEAVSTQVADEITTLYRQWSARLPQLPTTPPLANGPISPTHVDIAKQVASAHLICAYHWSIILLTRPFLMFHVAEHVQRIKGMPNTMFDSTPGMSTVATYAEFAIDSAIRGLDIAAELLRQPNLPKVLPFVTNSIFNSALAIGVAFFGDFDRSYPLQDALDKADQLLSHMSVHDFQARRFKQVVGFLGNATKAYVHRRDRSSMQDRQLKKNTMFGIIGLESAPAFPPPLISHDSGYESPNSFMQSHVYPVDSWNPTGTTPPMLHTSLSPSKREAMDSKSFLPVSGMVPTPPDNRFSDDSMPSILSEQPTLTTSGFLLNTSAPDFMTNGLAPHMMMPQGFQSEFEVLRTDLPPEVDMPMLNWFGEPVLSDFV